MNGSSVLGLEKRKMLISLSTKRVAFWKRMFWRRSVFRSMLCRTPATDVEAKRTERKVGKYGGAGFEGDEVLVEVVNSLLFLEGELGLGSIGDSDFNGGRHERGWLGDQRWW
jgi:hypothetical protein